MIGHASGNSSHVVPAAAKSTQCFVAVEQVLGRHAPQSDEHPRAYQIDLAVEVPSTLSGFVRRRVAIVGRPALDDISDVDILPVETDRLDDLRQELARPSDKRQTLPILFGSRPFADEHQLGLGIAGAEDNTLAAGAQIAERATHRLFAHDIELLVGLIPDQPSSCRRLLWGAAGDRLRTVKLREAELSEVVELLTGSRIEPPASHGEAKTLRGANTTSPAVPISAGRDGTTGRRVEIGT